jgi:phage terminase small subunit
MGFKGRYVLPDPERKIPKKRSGRPRVPVEERKLTRRQELFVKAYVSKDGQITGKDAAIEAGYPERSATCRASELLSTKKSPHVVLAIKKYRDELDKKYGVTYKRHLRDMQNIRDTALENGAYSAAVQAEKARGLAHGEIYVSKSEVRHGSIDSMSKEEVLRELKKIREGYTPGEDIDAA